MFIDNKYKRWYFNIVEKAKSRKTELPTEKHHIVPRTFGGHNKKANIVKLTFKEHFICHWLLTKFTEGEDRRKMFYALYMMKRINQHHTRNLTPAQFEIARGGLVRAATGRRMADETRQKMSQSALGKPKSTAHKQAISECQLGSKNHRFGKPMHPNTKRALMEANKRKQNVLTTN